MECFVCNAEAEELPTSGDYVPVNCPQCGEYRVVGTVAHDLRYKGRWLQAEAMRQWIAEQREKGAERPMINSGNVIWG